MGIVRVFLVLFICRGEARRTNAQRRKCPWFFNKRTQNINTLQNNKRGRTRKQSYLVQRTQRQETITHKPQHKTSYLNMVPLSETMTNMPLIENHIRPYIETDKLDTQHRMPTQLTSWPTLKQGKHKRTMVRTWQAQWLRALYCSASCAIRDSEFAPRPCHKGPRPGGPWGDA